MSPTINKNRIKAKRVEYVHDKKGTKFYSSPAWLRLRNLLLSHNPLCKECLKRGVITPAEHAHHIRPFLSGKDEAEQWDLFLKESNIVMVCSDCHHAYHNKINKYNMLACDDLTDTEYAEAHNIIE